MAMTVKELIEQLQKLPEKLIAKVFWEGEVRNIDGLNSNDCARDGDVWICAWPDEE